MYVKLPAKRTVTSNDDKNQKTISIEKKTKNIIVKKFAISCALRRLEVAIRRRRPKKII